MRLVSPSCLRGIQYHISPRAKVAHKFEQTLRDAIRNSGVPQNQIAKATGVTQPCINKFVNGKCRLMSDVMATLADFCGS